MTQSKFKIGDRVRFVDEVGEGKVVGILGLDKVFVEDDHGFEYEMHPNELIRGEALDKMEELYDKHAPDYKEIVEKNVEPERIKKATKLFSEKYNNEDSYRNDGTVEVDLHIHELLSSETGLDSGEKLKIQMEHFERMMNRAERERIKRMVFIHGVGQGVLRNEIRKHLKMFYPHISIMDGSYKDYGFGATEVRF